MDFPFRDLSFYGAEVNKVGSAAHGGIYEYRNDNDVEVKRHAVKKQIYRQGIPSSSLIEIVNMKKLCCYSHILPIEDIVFENGTIDMILPLATHTLTMEVAKTLDYDTKILIAYQIALGLAYCQNNNILHRDIKPDNILLFDENDQYLAMIADFGISMDMGCRQLLNNEEVYTLWYRSPEIILGGSYGYSADVWAYGCTIAELFTGSVLFGGNSLLDQISKIFNQLGTPSDEPSITDLPGWKLKIFELPKQERIGSIVENDSLNDLILQTLIYDQNKRISIYDVLKHPLFAHLYKEFEIISCKDVLTKYEEYPKTLPNSMHNRKMVFDWMLDVWDTFTLKYETLALSYYLFDKVANKVSRGEMQKYAATCLFIADKLKEERIPEIARYVDMTADSVKEQEMIDTEQKILKAINFKLYITTSIDFLEIHSYTENVIKLSKFLILLFYNTSFVFKYQPHDITSACLYVACQYYGEEFKELLTDQIKILSNNIPKTIILPKEIKGIFKEQTGISFDEFISRYQ